jgi:tRNA A-37 threonylcarbamoyl transferase component Bud32
MTEGRDASEHSTTVFPLGRYLVLAGLGRGGMADVYLALARGPSGFSKLVVLKLLREHLAQDQEFLRMFLAEARFAARLNHANIVQTYEVGVEDGRHCIVMEYLEGRSLADLEAATKDRPMALNLGLRVLTDTLAGLHHAHERGDEHGRPLGLVHRDVSPHNVLITYDGQVKVLDFGIAKAADDGAHTKMGVFKGKIRYTAPERFCGEACDRRADIFSVGVMLWQILAKRRLWSGMTDLAVMQQLANHTPVPSPRTVDPQIPEALERICVKALATSPDDRFQTALEMQDALEEFLSAESVGGTNRALGRFMGEVFRERRAQFQRVVDEQTRAAAEVPLDMELTGSVARLRAQKLPMLGSEGETEGAVSMALPSSGSRIKTFAPVTQTGSAPSIVASMEFVPDPTPSSRRRRFGLVALAAALAVVAVLVVLRQGSREPTTLRADALRSSAGSSAAAAPVDPGIVATTSAAVAPGSESPAASAAPAAAALGASVDAPGAKRVAPAAPHAITVRPRMPTSTGEARPTVSAVEVSPKREMDCSSPYFIDDQGMKKVRVECL